MATSATRVDVRAIHVHAADPDVRRSGRRAQREHDQDREDETDAGRHADQPRHPSVDAPDHLLTPGAERHPNADLARPPRDRERDDRIETDARQHQSEAAEDTETRGDHLRRRLRSLQILQTPVVAERSRTLSPAELEAGAVFRFRVNNRLVFNSFSRWRTRQRATWRHDPD